MEEIKEKINIEDIIYEVRGKQVMLDSDLAKLYQCKNGTKEINQAVKNNLEKFPERYSWILTEEEYRDLRSKYLTTNMRRFIPRVFTEQGVAMLATILKSKVASQVSIQIMDAFVIMRKYISNDLSKIEYMNHMLLRHDDEIKLLQESFSKFDEKKKINEIYFNGQIYDAYSKFVDIMKEAKEKLVIVDSYADKSVLDMISKVYVQTTLITKKNHLLKQIDIDKYNKQYCNLKIVYDNTFHDRYLILDNKTIYHCGTSLNHAGSRTFSINLLEDKIVKDSLLGKISKIMEE